MMHLKLNFASALCVLFLLFGSSAPEFAAQAHDSKPQRTTTLLTASLPPKMDGDKLTPRSSRFITGQESFRIRIHMAAR